MTHQETGYTTEGLVWLNFYIRSLTPTSAQKIQLVNTIVFRIGEVNYLELFSSNYLHVCL